MIQIENFSMFRTGQVEWRKFENGRRDMKFFSQGNFYRKFRMWGQNWLKFGNLTRERQFVHFRHFREDSSDHSQTQPEYRGRHSHQKSRKNWQYLWPFSQNCHFKSQKLAKFQKLRKFQNSRRDMKFYRRFRIWPQNWHKFCFFL